MAAVRELDEISPSGSGVLFVLFLWRYNFVDTGGSDKQRNLKRDAVDQSVSDSNDSATSMADFDFDLKDRRMPRRRWSMQPNDAPVVGKSDDMSAIYVDVSGDIIGSIVVSQCIRYVSLFVPLLSS
jgi:hypothetical protein